MIQSHTLRTIPFRIMRPTLKTIMGAALVVFAQTSDGLRKTDIRLCAKIVSLRDATNKLDNPTRHQLQTHLTAWYGVSKELADAIDNTNPELAALLRGVVKEAAWLEDAWQYMKGQMDQWQATQ